MHRSANLPLRANDEVHLASRQTSSIRPGGTDMPLSRCLPNDVHAITGHTLKYPGGGTAVFGLIIYRQPGASL